MEGEDRPLRDPFAMTLLQLPAGVHALLPALDDALAASLAGRDDRMIAVSDVARALRRADWPAEWVFVFVRDRLTREAAELYPDGGDLSADVALERARIVAVIECLRVIVAEPQGSHGEPVQRGEPAEREAPVAAVARTTVAESAATAPKRPGRAAEKPRSVPRRASGRELQIRSFPSRRRRS